METFVTSTSVTTSYRSAGPLLYPLQTLMPQAPQAPMPVPVQIPMQQGPCFPVDNYHPGPVQAPLPGNDNCIDGIPANQIRIGNVGELLIGGIAGHANHAQVADAIAKLKTNGMNIADLKTLGQASLKAGGLSAGISAAASAFVNIGAVAQGKISGKDAVSNVTTDTVGGLMAGTTAGLGAGAASLALRSFGAGGLVLSIGAAAAGAIAGLGGSKLYEATGLRQRVYNAAQGFMS